MTDYSKLVQALRKVADYINCYDCDMWGLGECDTERKSCVLHNAAAAIEALQADMKTYGDTAFKEGYEMGFAAGEARVEKRMEPKRGEWIHVEGDEPWEWRCTACHKIAEGLGEFRFCPNCGAKMQKEEERNV